MRISLDIIIIGGVIYLLLSLFSLALGQIMLYVDGMNGVINHNETIQWLYTLIGSKVRDYGWTFYLACMSYTSLFVMLSGMVLKKEVLFSSVPALSEHKQGLWFYRLKKIPQLQRTYYFLMHFSYFLFSFFFRFLATCAAYGVLVPQPGMEPGSGRVLTTEIAGKPFLLIFNQILLAPLVFNI